MKAKLAPIVLFAALLASPAGADNGAFGGSGGPPPIIMTPHSIVIENRIYVAPEVFEKLSRAVVEQEGAALAEIQGRTLMVYGFDDVLITGEIRPRRILPR